MYMQHHCHNSLQHLARMESDIVQLARQLTEVTGVWGKSRQENMVLTAQLNMLQQQSGHKLNGQLVQQPEDQYSFEPGVADHIGHLTPQQGMRQDDKTTPPPSLLYQAAWPWIEGEN